MSPSAPRDGPIETMSVLNVLGRVHRAIQEDGKSILDRILQTAEQMFEDRGYSDIQVEADPVARADAAVPKHVIEARHADGNVNLFVCNEERVGVKYVRQIMEHMEEGAKVIIVSLGGPTPFTKNAANLQIQFFLASEMCQNVTKHKLVPKHELVDFTQKDQLACLPHILSTDPVVRYHDWPCGTVVKIRRVFGGHESVPFFQDCRLRRDRLLHLHPFLRLEHRIVFCDAMVHFEQEILHVVSRKIGRDGSHQAGGRVRGACTGRQETVRLVKNAFCVFDRSGRPRRVVWGVRRSHSFLRDVKFKHVV